jgi:hypothetical protein
MYFFLFLLLCFWARIHVLLVSGCCIFVASLFCHKDSRIQAIYWHNKHVSMLTVTSCPMFWYKKCSPSCLIFGVIICSENGRTEGMACEMAVCRCSRCRIRAFDWNCAWTTYCSLCSNTRH